VRSSETGVGSTIGGGGWIAGVVAAPAGASIAAISGGNAGAGVCSGAAEAGAGLVAGGAGGPAVLGFPSSARSFWNAIVWSSRRVSKPADLPSQISDLDDGDDAPDQQPDNERQNANNDELDHGCPGSGIDVYAGSKCRH